jgi:hypothetical protein
MWESSIFVGGLLIPELPSSAFERIIKYKYYADRSLTRPDFHLFKVDALAGMSLTNSGQWETLEQR